MAPKKSNLDLTSVPASEVQQAFQDGNFNHALLLLGSEADDPTQKLADLLRAIFEKLDHAEKISSLESLLTELDESDDLTLQGVAKIIRRIRGFDVVQAASSFDFAEIGVEKKTITTDDLDRASGLLLETADFYKLESKGAGRNATALRTVLSDEGIVTLRGLLSHTWYGLVTLKNMGPERIGLLRAFIIYKYDVDIKDDDVKEKILTEFPELVND